MHSCWTDSHLHQFIIHGKRYGIAQVGGVWFSDDPKQVKLSEVGFREQEKFLYEYDFGDSWQHQIRVEAIVAPDSKHSYPVCIAGKRSIPPKDCGGFWRFMELKKHYSVCYALESLSEVAAEGASAVADHYEKLYQLLKSLSLARFDCHAVNRRLQQYAKGNQARMFGE